MLYIAYTREDALFAVQLAEDLNDLGVEVWLDLQEISATADWEAAQRAAIEASEGLIAVLSPEALRRDHMRREVQQAFTAGKQVHLAVTRRVPWRDWMAGLSVADFTTSYEAGLDALMLHITGVARADSPTDEAEQWLRQQEKARPPKTQGKQPRRSILGKLLRR